MGPTKWKRLAGFCALSAFALHGISALGLPSGSGIWIDGDFGVVHVIQVLPPDLPSGQLSALTAIGFVADTSGHTAALIVPRLQASRGPPA